MPESGMQAKPAKAVTRAEVGRIVNAARVLIEAHGRRADTSRNATLAEQAAMWELNFQLGTFRQKSEMTR